MNKSNISPTIHIVLVHPKMPSNTGNIIRLCANTGAQLHLLKPLGFELDDKKLRRAGLDYHEFANLNVYEDWQDLLIALTNISCQHVVALTTKFSTPFYDYDFSSHNRQGEADKSHAVALVFGSETDGLPDNIRRDIANYRYDNTCHKVDDEKNNQNYNENSHWLRLPMLADSRSLNLSNSVAICLYEVWRQLGFDGDQGTSIGYDKPNQPNK